jgi:hypothetical protein
MTDIDRVLEKLEEQNKRLDQIERAVTAIAVQDEKIVNLQTQVNGLWKKFDLYFSGNGVIPTMQQHQASCPRNQVKYIWGAVFVTALSVIIKFLVG